MSQNFRKILEKYFHPWTLLLILGLSAFLNTYNINFEQFFHGDEPNKFQMVLSGQHNFHHPILILQTASVINKVVGLKDSNSLIILCRMISAMSGVFIVWLVHLFSRQGLGKNHALLVALSVAVSPIMVIHAHYFKEDIIFTAFSYLSLICFLKFLRERTLNSTLIWGLATGLAVSAQYKGVLLILLFPLFIRFLPGVDRTDFYRSLRIALVVMGLVFLSVNYPLFFQFEQFYKSVTKESINVLSGHKLSVYPFQHWFGFHLINSLIPGMSLMATILGLIGLVVTIRRWNEAKMVEKLLLIYILVFYFAHELVPKKPFPDYMRYMIPIVPAMIYFAIKAINNIGNWMREYSAKGMVRAFPIVLMGGIVFLPFYDTWLLESNLIDDTRLKAKKWIDSSQEKTWYERYTLGLNRTMRYLTEVDISEARKSGVTYLVASSFNYDRYLIGSQWSLQGRKVYEKNKKYLQLFSYPYIEIKPTHKTFAFSNPVIRIIDIRDPEKLKDQDEKSGSPQLE